MLKTKLCGGEENSLLHPSPLHKKHYAGEGIEDGSQKQWCCPPPPTPPPTHRRQINKKMLGLKNKTKTKKNRKYGGFENGRVSSSTQPLTLQILWRREKLKRNFEKKNAGGGAPPQTQGQI